MSTTSSPDNYTTTSRSHDNSSPHLTVVLVIVILVILFSVFFALYFYKCFLQNVLQSRQRSSSPTDIVAANSVVAVNLGLDHKVLNTFPTCPYSVVKQYRKPKYGLECAICLIEFEDDHVLRLITICSHVFHQDCIDVWFEMHKTCPACRRNLELHASEGAMARDNSKGTKAGDTKRDSVSITIKDGDHEEKKGKFYEEGVGSFTRSKTTGHSLFVSRNIDEDRFTLRLPDHVTEELIKANHWPKHLYKSGSLGRKPYIYVQGSEGNV